MAKYKTRLLKITLHFFIFVSCVYTALYILPILCQVILRSRTRSIFQSNNFVPNKLDFETRFAEIENDFIGVVKEYFNAYEEYKKILQISKRNNNKAWVTNEETIKLPILPSSCEKNNFLLILIHSAPSNIEQRLAIRYGWGMTGNTKNYESSDYTKQLLGLSHSVSFRYVFVVGRNNNDKNASTDSLLRQEAQDFDDILYLDLEDNYHTLVLKTLQSLNWASENCKSEFILKTDDDCFVNTRAILKFLKKQKEIARTKPKYRILYTGRVQWTMPAIRDSSSKFFVPYDIYPDLLLPPYVSGGGYLFSGHLLPSLLEINRRVKTIPNEDSHIGYLMKKIGVKPVENYQFLPYIYCNVSIWERPPCDFVKPFVIHGVQNYGQLWMYYHVILLSNTRGVCKQSNRVRKHVTKIPLYCPVNLEM